MLKLPKDVVIRIGYFLAMLGIAESFLLIPENFATQNYFYVCLSGTIALTLATLPLRHSALGVDLRGILSFAFALELFYFCLSTMDATVNYYNKISFLFLPLEKGIWFALIFRVVFWHEHIGSKMLSYPKFDVLRYLLNETSDHYILSKKQKYRGYMLLAAGFFVGFASTFAQIKFSYGPFFAAGGIVVMILGRYEDSVKFE